MDADFVFKSKSVISSKAYMDKHREFSTSTPFFNGQRQKQDLQACKTSSDKYDSGLGASIIDLSVTSCDTTTVEGLTINSCRTPQKKYETCDVSSIQLPDFNPSASPVSTKRFPFTVESNFSSRKSFLARRSLDSDFSCSGDESCDSGQRTVSLNHSRIARCVEKSFVRKLDLDLDIYDNDVGGAMFTKPSRPSKHEANLSAQFNSIMQRISPIIPDRLIGRSMGREYVDILSELEDRGIQCLSLVLSYLDPQDLCRMCQVNQTWRKICDTNTFANKRRKRFMRKHQRAGKENVAVAGYKRNQEPTTRAESETLQHLRTIQTVVTSQHKEHTKTTTEHFVQAASKLKNDEKLQKCPRCRLPATVLPVQDRGKCTNPDCEFDFCIKCVHDFHGSKDCALIAKKKTKTDSIGTKKSKKNLKRL